ncbi:DUF6056 family protein [Streptomyces griseus]|uniref:DUF6056 family protein n=1 Tax=Streptomyces stephensoniae TaxID=3375367 RepID=A0ABU2W6S9_9ACTN|nr:DUF6056 family protein [Streptomyces griseus]MDT0493575.1 DUF6056 family protein [Streptomyces griseus]
MTDSTPESAVSESRRDTSGSTARDTAEQQGHGSAPRDDRSRNARSRDEHSRDARPQDSRHRDPRPQDPRPWTALWVTALALPPLALLAAASWFGRWVRPSADDWCFLPAVRDDGITGLVGKFYFDDNGRVANALLVGAYAKFQVAGHQWYPVISGVLVLAVLWAVTVVALRRGGITVPRGLPLLVAAMVTALFLFVTPNTYKTFYWPAASVSHTLPPVLACAALIPLLLARTRRGRGFALATVLVAGAFLATLSEETAIVVVMVLLATLLLSGRLVPAAERGFVRLWCGAGIAGTVAGALVLITSPGSTHRRERFGAETTSLLAPDSLAASLRAFAEITVQVVTTWQYVGAVAVGVLLGLLCAHRDGRTPAPPAHGPLLVWSALLTLLVSGYLCTVIAYPVFQDRVSDPSANRLWNDYLLLYVVLLVGAGALGGLAVRRYVRRTAPVKAVCAALCVLVCFGPAVSLLNLDTNMRARAEKWDAQDRRLREGAADGERVMPYERLVISAMLEPFSRGGANYWPGGCVADFYGLERVTDGARTPTPSGAPGAPGPSGAPGPGVPPHPSGS